MKKTSRGRPRKPDAAPQRRSRPETPPLAPVRSSRALVFGIALAVMCLVVYAPTARYDFVSFDDPTYVTENPEVSAGLTGQGVAWAFTSGHASNWHPLTWLSHMLDVELFGVSAGPMHLINVLLHVANTLLLFVVLRRLTGADGRSAFVAALFAVHPLHVESVAWISERKDVLSTLFWMLTMLAYAAYARRRQASGYVLVLACLALGLMSKPMLVTLPVVLLLLDLWPLRRLTVDSGDGWRPAILEKLPMLALALGSSVVTLIVQRQVMADVRAFPLPDRLANAAVSYVTYLAKALWPSDLAVLYPMPAGRSALLGIAAGLALMLVTVLAIRQAAARPYVTVGWLWYLITLTPVIGVIQVGSQSMADRYTYVPLIGVLIIVAWGATELLERWTIGARVQRIALPAGALAACLAYGAVARLQVRHWSDSFALWQRVLDATTENARAHNAYGSLLAARDDQDGAIEHFREAIRIEPAFAEPRNKLGVALFEQGRIDEAVTEYREALKSRPSFPEAHNNLANALARQGQLDEALTHYQEALRLNPGYAEALNGMGSALDDVGRVAEAIEQYRAALRINPNDALTHNNLAAALARDGDTEGAVREILEAVRLAPTQADFHFNAALVLESAGRVDEAIRHAEQALAIEPSHAGARQALDMFRPRAPQGPN